MQNQGYILPTKINAYFSIMAKICKKNSQENILKLIKDSAPRVQENWSSDFNDRSIGHAVYIPLHSDTYADIIEHKSIIENKIREQLNKINDIPHEFVAAVFLELDTSEFEPQKNDHRNEQLHSTDFQSSLWKENTFKVFLSHKSSTKIPTSRIKDKLTQYGISCFVAHEDIEPTKAWQEEIERALFSMDYLIALMDSDFKDSYWVNQEIGVAMGRRIPIISVKLGGLDPYGFIGKFQALKCSWEEAPKKIASLLISHEKMKDAYVHAIKYCNSYECGNTLAELLPHINTLSENQINTIVMSYKTNMDIKKSFGFNGTYPRIYGDGLAYHLKRITGNDYSAQLGS